MWLSTLAYLLSTSLLLAAENSSLTESKIEDADTKVTAESLLRQNEELRKQLSIQQESLKTLTASLAESNAEAELFRRKFADLESRMEALGLASASKDRAKLEQRLLAAVSDLRLAQKERDELRDQLLGLNEALLRYLKTSQGGDATGASGRGNAIAENQRAGGKIDIYRRERTATGFDGRERSQREGRMVVCRCEHWRAAGRENWDAAASDARRTKDRDVAGGGRAPADLRRGD